VKEDRQLAKSGDILRIGIAGLGEATTEFLPDYVKHPKVKVTAAADFRQAALDRFQQEVKGKTYRTLEEICQSSDVDIIYIATPHELHAKHTLMALACGKHVIVEKPMALTIEDCDEMNDVADRRGLKILCGHNHSYDVPIRKMREIIRSGELGPLGMIHSWNYNDFMVRPYPDFAMETSRGVVLNQGPHQVDIVRVLGGGMVRSVRARTMSWDRSRPGEGAYTCYLEFEDGVPATLVFNGYGFFDTAELFGWIGESGAARYPEKHVGSRNNYRQLLDLSEQERTERLEDLKNKMRYGNVGLGERPEMPAGWEKGGYRPGIDPDTRHQPFFGLTVVSCEKGDMRQSQDSLIIYGDEKREVSLESGVRRRNGELDELYECLIHGKPLLHDGRWGAATVEVCVAMLQSTTERKEISLSHQVPFRD
jgi:phthalate 4,5-cis-dihydrodiol dehydrogenase